MRITGTSVATGVCLCALAMTVAGAGRVLVFTTIDFPGAVLTNVQGINDLGELVGFYTDTAGKTHGFLRSGEQYRSIDFPGAGLTLARGIGPAGDIVGSYQRQNESGAVPGHGFLMTRRGGFFKVDYPGHQNTYAQRILADGTILGCYHDADTMGTMHGFVLSWRRGFDAIPESTTMHNGATPDGKLIVGLFTDMTDNRGKGYILDRGRFSPFEVPGSSFTAAWDVSPSGVIVGVFRDSAGFHGFHYDGQAFGRVDVAGASATRVFGINLHGDMVGSFVDTAGRTHGFLAQWTAAQ